MFSTIRLAARSGRLAGALALAIFAVLFGPAAPAEVRVADGRASFATADEAVGALVAALKANDMAALRRIFGAGSENLINSGDRFADQRRRQMFLKAYDEQHKLVPSGAERMVIDVGKNDWPMPIPL